MAVHLARREAPRHVDTIVIGAGVSGLACAARLHEHPRFQKHDSLLVLEARNRLGGRIGSVEVNGNRLDTGANWIHGIGTDDEPNPLMNVLPHKRYRQLSGMVAFRAPQFKDGHLEITKANADEWVDLADRDSGPMPSQNLVIPADTAAPLMGALWGMIGSLHEAAVTAPTAEAKQTPMLQAIVKSEALQSAFAQLPKDLHRTLGAMPQFIENMEAAPLAAQSSEDPKRQHSMSLAEFAIDDFDGDQVFLQDGYVAVIDEIAKDLVKAGVVQLDTTVEQIDWSAKPITVKTSKGIVTADRVVCTLPLGVLQHSLDTPGQQPLFEPKLPKAKSEAIASLGFGTLDKVFLVYAKPWWTEDPYRSTLGEGLVRRPFSDSAEDDDDDAGDSEMPASPDSILAFTDELAGIELTAGGTAQSGIRVLSFINLHNLTGFPVLSAFVSCSNAVHMESLSDKDAAAILHRALSRGMGLEIPQPDAVHVTRWASDQYSRGSYSHMITGVTEARHREEFQRPVVNGSGAELRFAGEHTSLNHFATVHGALLSGWREADGVLASP